jgi:hypothetical protein
MITERDFLLLNNLRPGALTTARTPPFSANDNSNGNGEDIHHTTPPI